MISVKIDKNVRIKYKTSDPKTGNVYRCECRQYYNMDNKGRRGRGRLKNRYLVRYS